MFQIKVEPCTCSKPVLGVKPKAFAPLSRPIKSQTKTNRLGVISCPIVRAKSGKERALGDVTALDRAENA